MDNSLRTEENRAPSQSDLTKTLSTIQMCKLLLHTVTVRLQDDCLTLLDQIKRVSILSLFDDHLIVFVRVRLHDGEESTLLIQSELMEKFIMLRLGNKISGWCGCYLLLSGRIVGVRNDIKLVHCRSPVLNDILLVRRRGLRG